MIFISWRGSPLKIFQIFLETSLSSKGWRFPPETKTPAAEKWCFGSVIHTSSQSWKRQTSSSLRSPIMYQNSWVCKKDPMMCEAGGWLKQPISKRLVKMGSSSTTFGVKIHKFQLPPTLLAEVKDQNIFGKNSFQQKILQYHFSPVWTLVKWCVL